MSSITLMRSPQSPPADREPIRAFLFGVVDGFSEQDKKSWRKFWKGVINAQAGELFKTEFKFIRNSKFHRKFFVLLTVGFEAWDPGRKHKTYKGMPVSKDFEVFRSDVTILAGHYEQTFNLRGEMILRAKSISFAAMDDDEFEQVYSSVANVLLETVLTKYAGREELDAVVERVIGFF